MRNLSSSEGNRSVTLLTHVWNLYSSFSKDPVWALVVYLTFSDLERFRLKKGKLWPLYFFHQISGPTQVRTVSANVLVNWNLKTEYSSSLHNSFTTYSECTFYGMRYTLRGPKATITAKLGNLWRNITCNNLWHFWGTISCVYVTEFCHWYFTLLDVFSCIPYVLN